MGRDLARDAKRSGALGTFFTLTQTTFEAFGFAEPLSRALTQVGYTTPTPIQLQALKPQLEGRDLLGLAETGSGKTATFVLPILQKIAAEPRELPWKGVSALVLAPTRELAVQIDQEVASLSRNMNIRRAVVLGGVSKGPQINALKRGVHVLVATPGRLLDHVNMRSVDLSGVDTLVIDEADRMFDMGFIRDINKIVSLIPMKRRTALFSATMPTEIKKFAYDILQDPFRIDLSTKTMVVDRIDQKVMIVRSAEKQSRLHTILKDEACSRVIVFTRTKRGADRVADRLGMAGIGATAFHGNKAQNARQRALADFTAGHVRVLVATDIAARGIDVSNVSHVVNFDMPLDPETYVHRVGRTARKGTSGIAISLCDPSEKQEITAIERMMKQKIEVIDDVGGEVLPMPEKRAHHEADRPRREGHRGAPHRGREGGHRDGANRFADRGPRTERAASGERHERPARSDAAPRHAASERPDHAPRSEHAPRGDRAPRADHAPRGERAERPAHAPRFNRDAKPQRAGEGDHGPRPDNGNRPHRGERHDRGDRQDRSDRPYRPEHQDRAARPSRDASGAEANGARPHHRADRDRNPRGDRAPHTHDGPRAPHGERSAHGASRDTRHNPQGEKRAHGGGHAHPHAASGKPPRDHASNGKPRQNRDERGERGEHGDRKPHAPSHASGKGGKPHWDGQRPPKFLSGDAPRKRNNNAKPAA